MSEIINTRMWEDLTQAYTDMGYDRKTAEKLALIELQSALK